MSEKEFRVIDAASGLPAVSRLPSTIRVLKRREVHARYHFDTIKSAVRAFNNRVEEGVFPGPDS